MKLLLANEIYFKGLAVKVFLGLKTQGDSRSKNHHDRTSDALSYLLHCGDLTENTANYGNSNPCGATAAMNGMQSAMAVVVSSHHHKNSQSYGGCSTALPLPDGTTILPNTTSADQSLLGNSTAMLAQLELMDRTCLVLNEIGHRKVLNRCFQAWREHTHLQSSY